MSISSSLNAGVAGLAANAARLAGISDNIANSGTYGYKRVDTQFEDMVISQARGRGHYSAGGVRPASVRQVDQKGALVSSSHPLDIAVSGRGMLPVTAANGDGGLLMTPTGSFRADADGVLRNPAGQVLMGWPASRDGTISSVPRDSAAALRPVTLHAGESLADPTTTMHLGINLPAAATRPGATIGAQTTDVEYFGNLGNAETLSITFTPVAPTGDAPSNSWTMEVRDSAQPPGAAPVGSYRLQFDAGVAAGGTLGSVTALSGGGYDPTTGQVTLDVGGSPMTIGIGRTGKPGGLTQFDTAFAPTGITRNGSPAGSLASVEVDSDGNLRATYDTGMVRTLYQIPVVDVANPNGLTALDNQTYQISATSGPLHLWNAGEGPTGALMGNTREASTTDVAAELTDLIQTQRAYSSNAKVIQTVDEMLQETTNIKR